MSIMYCTDHDCYYDSDFIECPQCEENASNEEDAKTLTNKES